MNRFDIVIYHNDEGIGARAEQHPQGEWVKFEDAKTLLKQCVEVIDDLLPGAAHIPCDIGRLNDTLMAVRQLTKD